MGREPRMVGSGVLPPLHSRHIWSSQLGLVHAILSCACLTMVTRIGVRQMEGQGNERQYHAVKAVGRNEDSF